MIGSKIKRYLDNYIFMKTSYAKRRIVYWDIFEDASLPILKSNSTK